MTIEDELKSLVSYYAKYDEGKKNYTSNLNTETLLRLDADFIKLINKLLLKDGPDKKRIENNYKKLARYFHPDRKDSFIPEVTWLEQNLSEGRNDGSCFKTLRVCFEKLISPQNYKPINFDEISTRDDLKKWLETLKENSRTYTERSFYASLLGLFHESTAYFDDVGQIKPKGLRSLVSFLPMIFISFGTFVFAEELFSVYALYFVLLKGGQYISSSNSRELKKLGSTLQKMSVISATATTTLLVRLIEMTFWASRQCYDMSLQIGSTLLTPLIATDSEKKFQDPADDVVEVCKDLILASQNTSTREDFKTAQLRMIAAPIESCLGLLEQQFFRSWRIGSEKYRELQAFLLTVRVIDNDDTVSVEDKIARAFSALDLVKKNKAAYVAGSRTALAVDQAERVINLLKEGLAETRLSLTY